MSEARAALHEVVPGLVRLVRAIPDQKITAIGTWSVGDVAAHLTHVLRIDTDAVAERPLPPATVTKAGGDQLTNAMLAEDRQRNPLVLADNIEALFQGFDAVAARSQAATISWLQGASIPPSAVACHLLEECLVHGHDIATATADSWTIQRRHALLAIEGFALPTISALPPTAFVNQGRSRSFRAQFVLRLRGGGRIHIVINDGAVKLDSDAGATVDAHVSADPTSLLLALMGRQTIWKPLLTGKALVWGRRPWKVVPALTFASPP